MYGGQLGHSPHVIRPAWWHGDCFGESPRNPRPACRDQGAVGEPTAPETPALAKRTNSAKGDGMRGTSIAVLAAGCALMAPLAALAAEGKAVYSQVCAQCHAAGVAGAPKTSDKGAWSARIASGREAMLAAVLKGKGAMPPKGGNASLSDADAKAAMDYILQQIK